MAVPKREARPCSSCAQIGFQGCFEAGRSRFNPYENVIGPSNARALVLTAAPPPSP
jgi:hypothetical protein